MKRSHLTCVLAFCLWGSVYVFSKYAMACFSPMTVMFIRNLITTLSLGERMTLRKGIGIVCALVGVVFVIDIDFGHISLAGVLCGVFGIALGALGSAMVRKVSPYYIPEQITICYFLISLPFCLITSIVETIRAPCPPPYPVLEPCSISAL